MLTLPKINDVLLRKAHDVRHLEKCNSCGGMGDDRRMLPGMPVFRSDGWHHGRCVVLQLSEAEVLALPQPVYERLRLDETGPDLMLKLLRRAESEVTPSC